jgi:hypothetical protein
MTKRPSRPSTTTDAVHPISVVAERTGLSRDVLRVWERRLGVYLYTTRVRRAQGEDGRHRALLSAMRGGPLDGWAVAPDRRVRALAPLPLTTASP